MKTVIGIDLSDKRLAMAKELGANGLINPGREDPYPKVLKLTGPTPSSIEEWRASGVDIVFECAGLSREQAGPSPLQQALMMTKQGGKVMVLSVSERPVEIEANLIMSKSIRVIGSPGWGWTADEFAQALELMRGKVYRKKLVTHEFSLGQAKEAYETSLDVGESIKVLIKP